MLWQKLLPYLVLLVPCSGGSVYFVDTQVVTTEGSQFDIRVGFSGAIQEIVNVIVSVSIDLRYRITSKTCGVKIIDYNCLF